MECVDEASAGIAGSMQCKAIGLSACRDLQSDESAAAMSTPGAVGDAAHCAIEQRRFNASVRYSCVSTVRIRRPLDEAAVASSVALIVG